MITLRHLLIAIALLLFLDTKVNAQSANDCQCIDRPKNEACWLYCLKYASPKQLIEKLKIDSPTAKEIAKLPNRKSYQNLKDLKASLPQKASEKLSVLIENSSVNVMDGNQEIHNDGSFIIGNGNTINNYSGESGNNKSTKKNTGTLEESGRSKSAKGNPGTLEANYSVFLNLHGSPQYKVIGSDAILKYFKLNGSHHEGFFIIAADKGVYYTNSDVIKKDQSYAFYLLGKINNGGWSHETHPCRPFCMIPGNPKLYIYSCGDNVSYKIADGAVTSADEITF